VEFREHWGGIFAAHPWLDGAADSYLGHWRRGGGATGEHSHAINLWQHMARLLGAGKVIEVGAMVDYIDDGDVDYDKICAINLRTESGLAGRVVQDVVTSPPRKWGRVQGRFGHVEWVFGHKPDCDAVWWRADDVEMQENLIKKTRPDDFLAELEHLRDVIEGDGVESPISLQRGLDTMLVIAAVHRSAGEKRVVRIDYDEGYGPSALSTD
jgi:predicted dehydrogenase